LTSPSQTSIFSHRISTSLPYSCCSALPSDLPTKASERPVDGATVSVYLLAYHQPGYAPEKRRGNLGGNPTTGPRILHRRSIIACTALITPRSAGDILFTHIQQTNEALTTRQEKRSRFLFGKLISVRAQVCIVRQARGQTKLIIPLSLSSGASRGYQYNTAPNNTTHNTTHTHTRPKQSTHRSSRTSIPSLPPHETVACCSLLVAHCPLSVACSLP
jgi:hypothetical protein